MKISQQIKQLRSKKKMSQRAFAEEINTSQWLVHNWENEKNYPSVKMLRAIYKVMGKKIDIYGGDNE